MLVIKGNKSKELLFVLAAIIGIAAFLFGDLSKLIESIFNPDKTDVQITFEVEVYETPKITWEKIYDHIKSDDEFFYTIYDKADSIRVNLKPAENYKIEELRSEMLELHKNRLNDIRLELDTIHYLLDFDHVGLIRMLNLESKPLENIKVFLKGKNKNLDFYYEVYEKQKIKYSGFFKDSFNIPYLPQEEYYLIMIWSDFKSIDVAVKHNNEFLEVSRIEKAIGFKAWIVRNFDIISSFASLIFYGCVLYVLLVFIFRVGSKFKKSNND